MKSKKFLICFLFLFILKQVDAQQILLYSENFNTGGSSFTLNAGGQGNNSGINQWIINNQYTGQPTYPNTISQDSTVAGSIANAPYSHYLHIHDTVETNSSGIANANYNPSVASDRFAIITDGFCTLGLTDVIFTFFYICEGSASAYGQLYYSIDNGNWIQTGQPMYNNQHRWKYALATDPAFANVANLRFGFRWVNDNGTSTNPASFGIDDIFVVGTYDDVNNPVSITVTNVSPNPVCQEGNITVDFTLSTPLCEGLYLFEISDATGSFLNAIPFGSIIITNQTSGSIALTLPSNLTAGFCYKLRIQRISPAPVIIGEASACIEIDPPLSFIYLEGPSSVCTGDTIDFTATYYGTAHYTWTNNGGELISTIGNSCTIAYNTDGLFYVEVIGGNACNAGGSHRDVPVSPLPIPTVIDNVTYLSTENFASYQWINCNGNTELIGQVMQNFQPLANGDYAVIATTNEGCSDTSACYSVTNIPVGIAENTFITYVISPNPNSGSFTINLNAVYPLGLTTLEIFNSLGQLIQSEQLNNQTNTLRKQLELNVAKGIYTVRLTTNGNVYSQKLVVK